MPQATQSKSALDQPPSSALSVLILVLLVLGLVVPVILDDVNRGPAKPPAVSARALTQDEVTIARALAAEAAKRRVSRRTHYPNHVEADPVTPTPVPRVESRALAGVTAYVHEVFVAPGERAEACRASCLEQGHAMKWSWAAKECFCDLTTSLIRHPASKP